MANTPLISIIVPVYNVERYLPRCIESILRQTYTNFELILVDDGTPDRSGIICDRYAEKDSRIKVMHKENGGVSTARNVGIDAAKGEWITFVDADDWVSNDYIEALVTPLLQGQYDLSVGSIEVRGINKYSKPLKNESIDIINANDEKKISLLCRHEFYGPWSILYSSRILRENNICFVVGMKYGEDLVFLLDYLKYCKNICATSKTVYYYNRLNINAATFSYEHSESRLKWWLSELQGYEKLFNSYDMSPSTIEIFLSKKTLFTFMVHIRACAKSCKAEETISEIEKSIELFGGYISRVKVPVSKKAQEFKTHIENHDVDAIYNLASKYRFLRRARICVDNIKLKCMRPFIEKHRDGLIKFKF